MNFAEENHDKATQIDDFGLEIPQESAENDPFSGWFLCNSCRKRAEKYLEDGSSILTQK
jgi:hypothetical protein